MDDISTLHSNIEIDGLAVSSTYVSDSWDGTGSE